MARFTGKSKSSDTKASENESILSRFKFVDKVRYSNVELSPIDRARSKFKLQIEKQIKHIQAEKIGKEYIETSIRTIKNDRGVMVRQEVPKRNRIWYWDEDGRYYTSLRYGTGQMLFNGGGAIDCGTKLDDIITTFNMVIEATDKGEFDAELMRLASHRLKRDFINEE